jgi:hypothetical protein
MEDDRPIPPPGDVFEMAERTVEYVRRATGLTLDYKPETLPILDHYLKAVPPDQQETAALVVSTAGAYFGEVLRQALGGEWDTRSEPWRLVLDVGVRVRPSVMVAAAVAGEDVDEEDDYEIPAAERQAVGEVLEEREVPEDEYYSLSGRLETMQLISEVIAAGRATRS